MRARSILSVLPALLSVLAAVAASGCGSGEASSTRDGGPDLPDGAVLLTDGRVLPPCEGIALEDDGALDLDLIASGSGALFEVSGQVSVDGAAITERDALGELVLEAGGVSIATPLRAGAPSYRASLPAGVYRVRYRPDSDRSCDEVSMLPCIGGTVIEEVAVDGSGVLDVAIATSEVHGAITVDGRPFERSDVGALLLESEADARRITLAAGGGYRARVVSGTYRIAWSTDGAHCDGATPPSAPCNGGVLEEAVSMASSGLLDIDLATASVGGRITAGGRPIEAGAVVFVAAGDLEGDDGGDARSFALDLGDGAAAAYAIRLLRGSYDLGFRSAARCDGRVAPDAPCTSGTFARGVAISGDGVLDLDVPTARIEGRLTIEGAPLAGSSSYRGSLVFSAAGDDASEDRGRVEIQLDASLSSYAATVLAGTYDIGFEPDAGACDGERAPSGPCNEVRLREGLAIAGDGVIDTDLPVASITGQVRLDGSPAPPGERGALTFRRGEDTFSIDVPLDRPYALALAPATYVVGFGGGSSPCAPGGRVPCVGADLFETEIGSDGALDIPLQTARVTGTVTIDGAPPADGPGRGSLRFVAQREGAESATAPAIVLPSAGAATYAATLLVGVYGLAWSPGSACVPASGPCNGGSIGLTVAVTAGGGALDVDVPVSTITGAVTLAGGPLPGDGELGRLSFEQLGGGTLSTEIARAGSGTSYAAALLPGRYVVTYAPGARACEPGGLPCEQTTLLGCDARRR
jgi:hypothetical protein